MSYSKACRNGSFVSLLALVAMAVILVASSQLTADTYTWKGGSNTFNFAASWLPAGGPPGAGDDAVLDSGGTYDVAFVFDVTNRDLTVGPGSNRVTFISLTGRTYEVTNEVLIDGAELTVGKVGQPMTLDVNGVGDDLILENDGHLTIRSGSTVFSYYGDVGKSALSSGEVVVRGGTWNNTRSLNIGRDGDGTLSIDSSGWVASRGGNIGDGPNSTGTVTVDNGTWDSNGNVYIGGEGEGTLNINADGRVENYWGYIGSSANSTGTVNVNGGTWTNRDHIAVGGFGGNGTLNINDDGLVENVHTYIGYWTDSTGTVNVNDGTWTNSDDLFIGNNGNGTLNIHPAGLVENAWGRIGYFAGSTGTVNVIGGTWTNSGQLSVGDYLGNGTLNVTNGGLVDVGRTLELGSNGVLNINGGIVTTDQLDDDGGTIYFTAGSVSVTDDLELTATGMLGNYEAITSNKTLTVGGATTIGLGTTLEVYGGSFTTGSLVNNGAFQFTSGTFSLTGDSLTVGAGGLMGGVVELGAGKRLDVTNGVTVDPGGVLSMAGGTLAGGTLDNSGLVVGNGYINANLSNAAAGEVRALAGDSLRFGGASNTNSGQINVIGGIVEFTAASSANSGQINMIGGTVKFTGRLSNLSAGVITGRGTLITGGIGLINNGNIGLAGGFSDIYGDVQNTKFATIAISGGATTVFWDDVDNLGTLHVGLNSSATFFGDFTGNGAAGPGQKYIEGDLKPGSSPGKMAFGGDVYFGPAAGLETELAGTSGDQFDVLDVAGQLSPGGTLQVVLIDGFVPGVGDKFDILDWGTLAAGSFSAIELPALTGRKVWDTSGLYVTGKISVIGMLDGDTDSDRDVDSDDLLALVSVFGGEGDWRTDFNEDGRVDLTDFALQRANFGTGVGASPPGAATAATPEPATLILMASGLPLLLKRKRLGLTASSSQERKFR